MSTVARRKRRGSHQEGHDAGMERWLLTYSDMITLLLALFVVLFAMSTINIKKFLEFKLGLTQTFNPTAISLPGGNGLIDQPTIVGSGGTSTTLSHGGPSAPHVNRTELAQLATQIELALARARLSQAAAVHLGSQAVVVQILADRVFFQTDSASLGATGRKVVDTIAAVVRPKPNDIEVQGYADNVPITGGPFSSNWELSAARAANVADRLASVDHVAPTRLSATGYSDTHPVASNATAAGRAENRRIDVVILGLPQG
jgi:chemotaxis protein MotB